MLVAQFDIHQPEPKIFAVVRTPHIWRIDFWVKNAKERVSRRITTQQPVLLSELMALSTEQVNNMLDELPGYTDAGFAVYKLR
jgi:hypothetical protein